MAGLFRGIHSYKRSKINWYLIAAVVAVFFVITTVYAWYKPIRFEGVVYLKVEKGDTGVAVVRSLFKSGVRVSPTMFRMYYRIFPQQINAGDYYLKSPVTIASLAKTLSKGREQGEKVTIPEGWTYKKIAELLVEKGIFTDADEFMKYFTDKDFIAGLGIQSTTLEGYLYPDTYYFVKGEKPLSVIQKMHEQLKLKLASSGLDAAIQKSPMTMQEILTLASIVEWEYQVSEEQPIIAQVFLKRLAIKQPLESCATVLYAHGKHKSYLLYSDLEIQSPFNTYKVSGLPPTPINSPSISSIRAVLFPADTDYLYFVSKNDGSHHFSRTYEEHLQARRKYPSWKK